MTSEPRPPTLGRSIWHTRDIANRVDRRTVPQGYGPSNLDDLRGYDFAPIMDIPGDGDPHIVPSSAWDLPPAGTLGPTGEPAWTLGHRDDDGDIGPCAPDNWLVAVHAHLTRRDGANTLVNVTFRAIGGVEVPMGLLPSVITGLNDDGSVKSTILQQAANLSALTIVGPGAPLVFKASSVDADHTTSSIQIVVHVAVIQREWARGILS